jgi:hypothetical protein
VPASRHSGASERRAIPDRLDRRRRASDGLLIRASILARLLGIRLLKLDATVVVSPAEAAAPHPRSAPPARRGEIGGGLPAAVQRINEGAEILAQTRRARSR